ncbi:MAG: rod shape-determining protein RodA [Candidatus Magasanikbacteria bacterium RIFOXYC2_FULL_42_28]|uniref:Rod shape-determining protein RodA n=1 Tax=Candidatus Magasanikbacteria bacterium RIFOXYC2_FULL_42_28 TaxID=1798704 RepID=A0A1F6NYS9_9BACT|nr:MAG: rod shape-determining protein RodA [Candidatus Magasanikbacteria bacterium RIFOXYC2_FULL_42_28]
MGFFAKYSWRNFDWPLALAVFLLSAVGLTAIYSIDLSRGTELVLLKRQLLAVGIGLVLFFGASATAPNFWRAYAKWFYGFCLILLLAVLFFGENIRGTTGWFTFYGFSFQPVELAKLGLILILAYVVANFGRRFERPLFFFGTAIITGSAVILILFQPDLGSAVIAGMIWFGTMVLVGVRRSYIMGLLILLVGVGVATWFFLLAPYQKDRVLTFIDPARDPLGAGYNTAQATIAIGSGRLFGRGLGFGSQSQLKFLPEAQTDFIFASIAEELGFAGAAAVIVLFGFLLWRLLRLAASSGDDFYAVFISGVAVALFGQFIVNVGANLGLLPVTGVTLPFVSYGGSSLIVNLLMIGMVESMVVRRY